jgi:hypothetical protein
MESTIAVIHCNVNPGGTEPDDIPTLVACEVGNESRGLVNLPSLCSSELVDDQVDRPKSATAVVQRRPASGISATNDVGLSIPGQVRYKAGVNANLPSSSAKAEVAEDGLHWGKGPIAIVARNKDVVFAETNDIETPVSCNVSKETEMTVQAPTTSIVAEVVQSEGGRAEV